MSGEKISTDGGQALGQNPFGALSGAGLPAAKTGNVKPDTGNTIAQTGKRISEAGVRIPEIGNKELGGDPIESLRTPQSEIRNAKNRGGKTVTVADGFVGIGLPEKEQLAKKIRAACGCGGTVKDGAIVIQGDQRETVARILSEAGFRPMFAGG